MPREAGPSDGRAAPLRVELPSKELDSEALVLSRLSRSPYLLDVSDSILRNLDREALADLLASYLYLSSKGSANPRAFAAYALSRRLRECVAIAASATPALLAGIVVDADLRAAVLSSLRLWIRGRHGRDVVDQGRLRGDER